MEKRSEILTVGAPPEEIYKNLSNFKEFGRLMPHQVSDWQAQETSCSFSIQNMAKIAMVQEGCIVPTLMRVVSRPPTPFEFSLSIKLKAISDTACESVVVFEADLNPMMAMMLSKPMENLVTMINQRIQELYSRPRAFV